MNEKRIREAFCSKISDELELFHLRKLQEEPDEIYASSYEINIMVTLYEVLAELSETAPEEILHELLLIPHLLLPVYEKWIESEDMEYENLKEFVKELFSLGYSERSVQDRKGDIAYEAFGLIKRFIQTGVA